MPSRRLKKLVRAHQRKTGERYTKALEAVLASPYPATGGAVSENTIEVTQIPLAFVEKGKEAVHIIALTGPGTDTFDPPVTLEARNHTDRTLIVEGIGTQTIVGHDKSLVLLRRLRHESKPDEELLHPEPTQKLEGWRHGMRYVGNHPLLPLTDTLRLEPGEKAVIEMCRCGDGTYRTIYTAVTALCRVEGVPIRMKKGPGQPESVPKNQGLTLLPLTDDEGHENITVQGGEGGIGETKRVSLILTADEYKFGVRKIVGLLAQEPRTKISIGVVPIMQNFRVERGGSVVHENLFVFKGWVLCGDYTKIPGSTKVQDTKIVDTPLIGPGDIVSIGLAAFAPQGQSCKVRLSLLVENEVSQLESSAWVDEVSRGR